MKNFIIVNTKGGVGKTTIGLNVLPILFKGKINYFQLDNNNKIVLNSKNINITEFRLNALTEALAKIEFSDNDINIIDAGGGDDTILVLKELANSILENLIFIVPVSKNLSIQHNIVKTINEIHKHFENPDIYLFLNYVTNKNIKEEFINIFGSELYNISPLLDTLDVNKEVFGIIPDTNLFQILELKKEILLDKFLEIENLVKNKTELLKKKKEKLYSLIEEKKISREEAEKEYILFNKKVKQAEKVVELVDILKKSNADFKERVLTKE